ncbi:hypothetical protein KJ866_00385 [Patescibacteria group bacterium]|nr:hypothetical protein [Patescibacteria group bacterium]MBU2219532.1 hypothetical protein [Patescibacteria group bacterium]MBU2265373.1 hypothetical protein [Patescibacteria group bacterium]
MKKFILLLVLAVVFISVFYFYLTSSAIEHPLGVVRFTILILLGGYGALTFYGALCSAPQAGKELKLCYRRRQSRKKSRRQGRKCQGTTTVVLD